MDKNNQIDYTQNLLEDGKDDKYNAMFDNKVDKLNKLQPLPKNTNGWIIDVERITVLKNDEWSYDTYIKSNSDITKDTVIEYVNKLEKKYAGGGLAASPPSHPPNGTASKHKRKLKHNMRSPCMHHVVAATTEGLHLLLVLGVDANR